MELKIAIVGFDAFSAWAEALREAARRADVLVVDPQSADMLVVPHHLDDFFPPEKRWVALWIPNHGGGSARFPDWREMQNPPQELFRFEDPGKLVTGRAKFFEIMRQRLAKPISWK